MKGPTPKPEAARFWAKVDTDGECWIWTASHNGKGYGQFYLRSGRKVYAHRWAYEAAKGPIPAGLTLDHLCRVPECVRPSHLEAVTHRVNCLRGNGLFAAHARNEDCGGPRCRNCARHRTAA